MSKYFLLLYHHRSMQLFLTVIGFDELNASSNTVSSTAPLAAAMKKNKHNL